MVVGSRDRCQTPDSVVGLACQLGCPLQDGSDSPGQARNRPPWLIDGDFHRPTSAALTYHSTAKTPRIDDCVGYFRLVLVLAHPCSCLAFISVRFFRSFSSVRLTYPYNPLLPPDSSCFRSLLLRSASLSLPAHSVRPPSTSWRRLTLANSLCRYRDV